MNIPPETLLQAGAIAAAILVAGLGLRHLAARYYRKLAQTTRVEFTEVLAHVIARTSLMFLLVISLAGALQLLTVRPKIELYVQRLLVIALFWQIGLWMATAADEWLRIRRQKSIDSDKAALGTLAILGAVVPAVIWALMFLLALDNLGVNVSTLIAGLGIGGVAIALAVQNVLGDLLASLSIAFDKPFVVGDFLVIDAFMGSVEYIGMKSTRLRSLSGEQIIISNANLLSSRLRNYGHMESRRIQFTLSVPPQTPGATLKALPDTLAGILRTQPQIRFDRCHVAGLSGAGIDIECVYVVLTADYNVYMDLQQQIILRIHESLEASGVQLAGPTQRVLLDPPVNHDLVIKASAVA